MLVVRQENTSWPTEILLHIGYDFKNRAKMGSVNIRHASDVNSYKNESNREMVWFDDFVM